MDRTHPNSHTKKNHKKRETLKYEIGLFVISFYKDLAQLRRKGQSALENRSKILGIIKKFEIKKKK